MRQLELQLPLLKWRWAYRLAANKYLKSESMLVTDEWYGEDEVYHVFTHHRQGWEVVGRVHGTEEFR